MKKIFLILNILFFVIGTFAQAPESFNFQSVITDQSNKVHANKTVSLRFSIIKNSTDGEIIYQETHSAITNNYGITNLTIGNGDIVLGVFSDIEWFWRN